jgi:ankyrin repeat protein
MHCGLELIRTFSWILAASHLTPLHFASGKGYATIAQSLIDHGADVDYQNPVINHQSNLMLAVIYGHVDVVEVLLRAGANPDLGTTDGPPLLLLRKRVTIPSRGPADRALDQRMITLLEAYVGGEYTKP